MSLPYMQAALVTRSLSASQGYCHQNELNSIVPQTSGTTPSGIEEAKLEYSSGHPVELLHSEKSGQNLFVAPIQALACPY